MNLPIPATTLRSRGQVAGQYRFPRGVTGFTPESLALYMQAALQGAYILAKAKGGAEVARDCIKHLRRHVELLFNTEQRTFNT